MDFRVKIKDYGRAGVTATEPRTGLTGEGSTQEDALDDLRVQLWHHIEYDFVPPAEGPRESIITITV